MFDDIIVPKSYLKGLLTKEQEKLVKDNNYQTKSLENFLGQYKIHKQKLYTKQGDWKSGKDGEWIRDSYTGKINFYNSFHDKDKNSWWSEYEFTFEAGVLDKKELIKFEMEETAEEAEVREKENKEWAARRDAFQRTFKYRFFSKLYGVLNRFLNWLLDQTITPHPKYIKPDRQRAVKRARKNPSFWKDW